MISQVQIIEVIWMGSCKQTDNQSKPSASWCHKMHRITSDLPNPTIRGWIWDSLFSVISCSLWLTRSDVIYLFNHKEIYWSEVIDVIKVQAAFWVTTNLMVLVLPLMSGCRNWNWNILKSGSFLEQCSNVLQLSTHVWLEKDRSGILDGDCYNIMIKK